MARLRHHYRRGFEPGVPVHTNTRFVLQLDLLKHPALKRLAIAIILRAAARCKVRVDALAVLDDHAHPIVTQGEVTEANWAKEGIWPFTRNWKRELSRCLGVLGLKGCKYEAPYYSTNLKTYGDYLGACTYVMDQAGRHGARREDIFVSDAILRGEVDGVMEAVPVVEGQCPFERLERVFADLVERTMDEAARRAVISQQAEGEEAPERVSEERRARRSSLEAQRERRAMLDGLDREQLTAAIWYEAAHWVVDHAELAGVEGTTPIGEVRMQPLAELDCRWADRAEELAAYRLPGLSLRHEKRDPKWPRRITSTWVSDGETEVEIHWSRRRAPESPDPPV